MKLYRSLFSPLVIAGYIFFCSPPAFAKSQLTNNQRIEDIRRILFEVDPRSTRQIAADLREAKSPDGQLQILEAVAKTYKDMVEQYEVKTQPKKEWLHSMILLNVAFYQFGGVDDEENTSGLNIVIRRKLKSYLPEELLQDPKLFYSLEN